MSSEQRVEELEWLCRWVWRNVERISDWEVPGPVRDVVEHIRQEIGDKVDWCEESRGGEVRPSGGQLLESACQLLISRVRFEQAVLRLPTTPFPEDDTPAIREATRLYVESWVVPIIEAIGRGDAEALREMVD